MRRLAPILIATTMLIAACGDDDSDTAPPTEAPSTEAPAAPSTEGPGTDPAIVPITVEQLLARSSDTPVQVAGPLFVVDGAASLCTAIMESYPPQCGGPSAELTDLDPAAANLQTEGSVSWSESAVLEVQRNADGTFQVLNILAS